MDGLYLNRRVERLAYTIKPQSEFLRDFNTMPCDTQIQDVQNLSDHFHR